MGEGGDQVSGADAMATGSSSNSKSSSSGRRRKRRSSSDVDGKQNKNETHTKQQSGQAVELELRRGGEHSTALFFRPQPSAVLLEPVTVRARPLATGDRVMGATVSTPPLRKLLFSATLTNNPQKLAGLGVVNPLIYTAREKTATPVAVAGGSADGSNSTGGGGVGGDGAAAAAANRPSQETRRSSTLDEIAEGVGSGEGRFSTPATLHETYTVCDSQVILIGVVVVLT